jgi:hypothetical protein
LRPTRDNLMKRLMLVANEQGCMSNSANIEDVNHPLLLVNFLVDFGILFSIGLVSIRLLMVASWNILFSLAI